MIDLPPLEFAGYLRDQHPSLFDQHFNSAEEISGNVPDSELLSQYAELYGDPHIYIQTHRLDLSPEEVATSPLLEWLWQTMPINNKIRKEFDETIIPGLLQTMRWLAFDDDGNSPYVFTQKGVVENNWHHTLGDYGLAIRLQKRLGLEQKLNDCDIAALTLFHDCGEIRGGDIAVLNRKYQDRDKHEERDAFITLVDGSFEISAAQGKRNVNLPPDMQCKALYYWDVFAGNILPGSLACEKALVNIADKSHGNLFIMNLSEEVWDTEYFEAIAQLSLGRLFTAISKGYDALRRVTKDEVILMEATLELVSEQFGAYLSQTKKTKAHAPWILDIAKVKFPNFYNYLISELRPRKYTFPLQLAGD